MSEVHNTKQQKRFAVSVAALEVIEKDGLSGITHSKVARRAKVSRAWIYEYIGKEKSALIEFAADVFANHFAKVEELELSIDKDTFEYQLNEAIAFVFDTAKENPTVIKLYFLFRGTENSIGQVIQKYEKQWLKIAAKTASEALGTTIEQGSLLAELTLVLRLGFAHRLATSDSHDKTRERFDQIFNFMHTSISSKASRC